MIIIRYLEIPKCDICKMPMDTWIAFASRHVHDECVKEDIHRAVDKIFINLRKQFGLPIRTANAH